jgi:hypothetical protein
LVAGGSTSVCAELLLLPAEVLLTATLLLLAALWLTPHKLSSKTSATVLEQTHCIME